MFTKTLGISSSAPISATVPTTVTAEGMVSARASSFSAISITSFSANTVKENMLIIAIAKIAAKILNVF